ncbi:helix-turn-helix transcriptional regulator [Paraclostridium sordellii]|uniref:helix-turn-helix transcriptional regulator n=1 Tax=Paraclostridium sordellii TaxID=1505 RepID=UPI0030D0E15F
MKIRTNLKEVRKNKNLTQLQVANKLNIERSYYTKIERGQRTPSLDIALKIKEILNYNDDDIFKNN